MKKKYDKTVMQKAQEVFLVMSKRVSGKDMVRIREAFEFACEAHAGQKRKSGEPYIVHPIEVASIVARELELGANPVIAAFLHDVVEDTKFTIDNNNKVTSDGTVSKTNDGTPVLVVKDNMTVVEVSKVAITGEKELKGANIQILDDKGNIVTVKDHEGNDVKCEWVSTGKPHKVEGLEINKTYTLHETIQPDGYTIATDATFSIDKDNNVKYSGKKNDSGVLLIEDKPTKVKISKTDVAHEKELQGATLQILDSEGNVVEIKDNDGKVVEKCEWASGKEPKYIEGLKTNVVYTLRETIAPNGYTIATDIQFTIKDDGKVESTGKTIKAEETEDGVEVLLVEDEPTKLYVSKQAPIKI